METISNVVIRYRESMRVGNECAMMETKGTTPCRRYDNDLVCKLINVVVLANHTRRTQLIPQSSYQHMGEIIREKGCCADNKNDE
jgi:hypothetical protein